MTTATRISPTRCATYRSEGLNVHTAEAGGHVPDEEGATEGFTVLFKLQW